MSEHTIDISVITPVYNGEDYIRETIESICSQRQVNLEYIVVNDGSTDGSALAIESALAQFAVKSQVLTLENGGEANAVNKGVSASRGRYICIVSADDPLLPDHLSAMVQVLDENRDCVVAYPDWISIDETGRILRSNPTQEYDIRALAVDFVCIPGPGAVIRREALGGKPLRNPGYVFVSDYEAWLRLALVGPFIRVPRTLAKYRIHSNQATSIGRGLRMAEEIERVVNSYFARNDLPAEIHKLSRRARGFAAYYAGLQRLHDRSVSGKRLMIKSFVLARPRKIDWPSTKRNPLAVIAVWSAPFSSLLIRWRKVAR